MIDFSVFLLLHHQVLCSKLTSMELCSWILLMLASVQSIVIRDSTGKVIGALSERIALLTTVDDVEALACRRAIEFAMEKGLQQVIFKGDSATVLNCIQAGSPCLAPFGNAIEDSISLASHLSHYSFSHVRRKGNTMADKLAKLAKYLDVPKVWLEDIPSDVNSLGLIDSSFAEV